MRRPGLDLAVCRSVTDDAGEMSLGVGGHSGFRRSAMGLEMFGLLSAKEEPREERDDGPFPLIDSVSLDHEKERELRVVCCLLDGVLGGVTSPMGMRLSTSLCERLSLRIVSFSSIVAVGLRSSRWWGYWRSIVARARSKKSVRTHYSIVL